MKGGLGVGLLALLLLLFFVGGSGVERKRGGEGEVVDGGVVLMNMIQSRRWTSSRTQ